jgi:hypothetical protein
MAAEREQGKSGLWKVKGRVPERGVKFLDWDADMLVSLCLFPRSFLGILPTMIENFLDSLSGIDVLPAVKHYLQIATDPRATDDYIRVILFFLLRYDASTKALFVAYSEQNRLRNTLQLLYHAMDMLFRSCIEECNADLMIKHYLDLLSQTILFNVQSAGLVAFHAYGCTLLPLRAITSANPESDEPSVDLSEKQVLENASKSQCLPLLVIPSEKRRARVQKYLDSIGLEGSQVFYPDTPRPPFDRGPDIDYIDVYANASLVRTMDIEQLTHVERETNRDRYFSKGSATKEKRTGVARKRGGKKNVPRSQKES